MNKFVVCECLETESTVEWTVHKDKLTMPEAIEFRNQSNNPNLQIMSQSSYDGLGESFIVYSENGDLLNSIGTWDNRPDAERIVKGPHKHFDYSKCKIMTQTEWDSLENHPKSKYFKVNPNFVSK